MIDLFTILGPLLMVLTVILITVSTLSNKKNTRKSGPIRLNISHFLLVVMFMLVSVSGCSYESNEKKDYIAATVIKVVDGDTMKVQLENNEIDTIRLLLVDTPETVHPSKPVMPFGPEASKYAKEQLTGEDVQLFIDVSERDKYGRLLVYLHVDGHDFNKALIEKGLARVAYVWAPNTARADEYYEAQKVAQSKGIGIWSIENYARLDKDGGFDYEEAPKQEDTNESKETEVEVEVNEQKETRSYDGPFDPFGPDKDCGDFSTHAEAQAFFEAAGGPETDPHKLDGRDKDGLACESLP